jgi:hypothetical protein
MAYMFWQYAKKRQGTIQARLSKNYKFPDLMGRQLQVWFMEMLHRKLICQDRKYDRSRLSFPREDDDILIVSDIPSLATLSSAWTMAHRTSASTSWGWFGP